MGNVVKTVTELRSDKKRVIELICLVLCYLLWIFLLRNTDSHYVVYILIGVLGIILTILNKYKGCRIDQKYVGIARISSVLYACTVVAANYRMLGQNKNLTNVLCCGIVFGVGYLLFYNIFLFLRDRLGKFSWKEKQTVDKRGKWVFIGTFGMVCLVDMLFLLGYMYPGTVTADSLWQIQQSIDHSYFNHHPFWHTMFIRVCIKVGRRVFGTINGGVAIYSILQILMMSFVIAYAYITMYQMNVRKWVRVVILLWYVSMPFHIAYSVSMWKDVFFGTAVLLYITAFIRIINSIGKSVVANYMFLAVGTIGFTVFRSNGWIALAISIVIFTLFFWKKIKPLIIMMFAILVTIKIINIPVFEHYNVTETDIVESLSIPAQQIARVFVDGGKISNEEKKLLEKVVNTEKLSEVYLDYISDPVKDEIFMKGNTAYIVENKWTYLKLWMNIGIKNPRSYIHAWIDQTEGYWNAGGMVSLWSTYISKNDYDIHRDVKVEPLYQLWDKYLNIFLETKVFDPIVNVGMYVWVFAIFFVLKIRDSYKRILPFVPIWAIWFTLLIATPVCGELRYIYALFTCLPIIVTSIFYEVV